MTGADKIRYTGATAQGLVITSNEARELGGPALQRRFDDHFRANMTDPKYGEQGAKFAWHPIQFGRPSAAEVAEKANMTAPEAVPHRGEEAVKRMRSAKILIEPLDQVRPEFHVGALDDATGARS